MKKIFFAMFFLTLSVTNYAQPKFVTLPNGGMVPCDHPLAIAAGLGCAVTVALPAYDCDGYINPYAEGERAAYCAARTIKPPKQGNTYAVGEKYEHPYANNRMVVIGITRDIYGRTVVTYQWYAGWYINQVNSFIVGVNEHPFIKIEE